MAKIINQLDNNGNLPLGLALSERQTAIAATLCKHKADVNAKDQYGWSLLQRAIQRGKELIFAQIHIGYCKCCITKSGLAKRH